MSKPSEASRILIFTDGACSGNPGPGGWGTIILNGGLVRELGGGSPRTTNNRMELTAAVEGLKAVAGSPAPVDLYTDSTYMISGATSWIAGWRRRGWKTSEGGEVLNRDIWEELARLLAARRAPLKWHYVRGHTGSPGNTRCDEIAVAYSHGKPIRLYDGPLMGYNVDLLDIPADTSVPERPKSAGSFTRKPRVGGYYLSLLDGKLERHDTWADCSARVHGRNAKFKKVSSPAEEKEALEKWGL